MHSSRWNKLSTKVRVWAWPVGQWAKRTRHLPREFIYRIVTAWFLREPISRRTASKSKAALERINHSLSASTNSYRPIPVYLPPPLIGSRPHVEEHENAQLLGQAPVGLNNRGELLQETIFRTSERTRKAVAGLTVKQQLQLSFPAAIRHVRTIGEGPVCLLTSRWDSFGHWIPEHFLKIYYLQQVGYDIRTMTFLYRPDAAGFKTELLERAGIHGSQLVTWTGEPTRVERLIVPDYPEISYGGLKWISSLFDQPSESPGPSRMYLSRQDLKGPRKIENKKDVLSVLKNHSFETVYPEKHSLSEQAALFGGARIIFGPQGSAFTGQLFMPAQSTVIEAFGQDRVHLFNKQMSLVLGHDHRSLINQQSQVTPNSRGFMGRRNDQNVTVDLEELDRTLDSVRF